MLHDVLDDITACIQICTDRDDATSCFNFFVFLLIVWKIDIFFLNFFDIFRDEKQEENVGKLRID